MRAVLQRVSRAKVTVGQEVTGEIRHGLLILLGVSSDDTETGSAKLAEKTLKLRIFDDPDGKMNLSVAEIGGELLVVSQFTLYADTRKGRRPSYVDAARPELAEHLYDHFVSQLRSSRLGVATGRFQAMMNVELVNDGPVTIILDTND